MDGVASVHCADATLREAMSRLVPPELGQTHLSPDGGGQLIALHVAAVTLLVEMGAWLAVRFIHIHPAGFCFFVPPT